MKIYFRILALLSFILIFTGCKKILEPEDDNHNTLERTYNDPYFAEGLLIRAYTFIPTNGYRWDDVATDDAVSNNTGNAFTNMATGAWSATNNPQDMYQNGNQAILYINKFLSIVDQVKWHSTDSTLIPIFGRRLKGESYALRGLFKYYLARNHGGIGTNSELLGVPIYDEFVTDQATFANSKRAAFTEFVNSAYADFDQAIALLPMDYGNITDISQLPAGFTEVKSADHYNTVFGTFMQQRISGRITKALKSKLALLEASPAFNANNNSALWEKAANLTADLLKDINGIQGLDPNGYLFYLKAQVDDADLTAGDRKDPLEILWRRPYDNATFAREAANFPPSLYGGGDINPTQNIVDAFPTVTGYPISDPASGYSASAPYTNRDPRLAAYIVYNGSRLKNTTITTAVGGGVNAVDSVSNSTRTGYYMKKLLREDVTIAANASQNAGQKHFETHIRFTELFLNYAEAANEAWGPTGGPYAAIEVIRAIRKRAGIRQPDAYLATVSTKDALRTLIRNERRLELCFEGHRFWDLRRWKEDLTVPAYGVKIVGNTYTVNKVEDRVYNNSYMMYGPIPAAEVTKFNLIQNKGW